MVLYRLLISGFAGVILARLALFGPRSAISARLGMFRSLNPGAHLCVHAASNGELTSVKWVLEALQTARPDLNLLITANSETGVAMARAWNLPRTQVELAPLDLAWVTQKIDRRFQAVGFITLESEIWPNRVLTASGPVLVLGARLTSSSAKTWRRFPKLAARLLRRIAYLSAQDHGSMARFHELGLQEAAIGPVVDLKAQYQAPADMVPDKELCSVFPRATTWLAASTHPGEEALVLEAHKKLLLTSPDAQLILAPRHPKRAEKIVALIRAAGFRVTRRSLAEAPERGAVYLADTMGEMPLWYQLAGRVYIGGSQSDLGGHTPFESAWFAQAILHGPDTANHLAAYDHLQQAQAAVQVRNAQDLCDALIGLEDPQKQQSQGAVGKAALTQDKDAEVLISQLLGILNNTVKNS